MTDNRKSDSAVAELTPAQQAIADGEMTEEQRRGFAEDFRAYALEVLADRSGELSELQKLYALSRINKDIRLFDGEPVLFEEAWKIVQRAAVDQRIAADVTARRRDSVRQQQERGRRRGREGD